MTKANDITMFESLKKRAKKLKRKLEIITDAGHPYSTDFAIGPTNIKNYQSYLDKNYERNEQDICKVYVYSDLDEVARYLDGVESCL